MSYGQSEMYKLTTYLKDLPLRSVSSKKNLQVVGSTLQKNLQVPHEPVLVCEIQKSAQCHIDRAKCIYKSGTCYLFKSKVNIVCTTQSLRIYIF